jgi:hypothetical protein
MYTGLLHTHSLLRYLVLLFLLIVIVNSFLGFSGKKGFGKLDNGLSLTLFSVTHTQFLVGILLYFTSPFVQFSGAAMKDHALRYWTAEHNVMMLIAIALITAARTTMKKMTDGPSKHKRMFIFNSIALVVILVAIAMSQRGFFGLPG